MRLTSSPTVTTSYPEHNKFRNKRRDSHSIALRHASCKVPRSTEPKYGISNTNRNQNEKSSPQPFSSAWLKFHSNPIWTFPKSTLLHLNTRHGKKVACRMPAALLMKPYSSSSSKLVNNSHTQNKNIYKKKKKLGNWVRNGVAHVRRQQFGLARTSLTFQLLTNLTFAV